MKRRNQITSGFIHAKLEMRVDKCRTLGVYRPGMERKERRGRHCGLNWEKQLLDVKVMRGVSDEVLQRTGRNQVKINGLVEEIRPV